MKWIVGILVCVGLTQIAVAHRLDECLQAVRVAVSTNRVALSIDITPGVEVVEQFLATIDRDHDEKISNTERAEYAAKVLKDLAVQLNDHELKLTLIEVTASPVEKMKEGLGVVRIEAGIDFGLLSAGTHTLNVTNNHLPELSVYLVNALKPTSDKVTISSQTRDELQKSYQLKFNVSSGR